MQHMKPAIIDLIEQGYGNADIVEALNCTKQYVRSVRYQYNRSMGQKKFSQLKKPKAGTKWREVYDFFVANPRATDDEASKATGANRGSCYHVRSKYPIPFETPKVQITKQVHLGELELIE